jgi:addiction module RelE/StbE family toxin
MHVRFSEDAEADLVAIFDYLAERNPQAAARVIDRILTTSLQLETFPLLGRPGRATRTRELPAPRTPYIVIYSLPDEYHVEVERVLHGAQLWPLAGDE